MTGRTALEGLRVLDLGTITAGAATSVVLADFGADVIKVEWPGQPDPFRAWTQIAPGQGGGINASPPFHVVNRNKRSIGINLKSPAGCHLLLRLVASSDIVVENFRRGVLERLGIGFEAMLAANPRIVLLSLTSQGVTGPAARYGSFGSTLDALGGLMSVTGYDAQTPTWSSNNVNYPDQLVSLLAPGVALAALRQVRDTGTGVWVDFSQRESVSFAIGERFVEYGHTGESPTPQANRAAGFLQDVYRSTTADRWVAVSARLGSDAERALRKVLEVSDQDDIATVRQRLSDWIGARDHFEAEHLLRTAGVPASVVRHAVEVMGDEQLAAVDFFQRVNSPLGQTTQRGFLSRLTATPGQITETAPDLGEHTEHVLRELGLDDRQLAELHADEAIFLPEQGSLR